MRSFRQHWELSSFGFGHYSSFGERGSGKRVRRFQNGNETQFTTKDTKVHEGPQEQLRINYAR